MPSIVSKKVLEKTYGNTNLSSTENGGESNGESNLHCDRCGKWAESHKYWKRVV